MTETATRTGASTVGTFHATCPSHDRPRALDTWLITTDHADLATALTEHLGGQITTEPTAGRLEVQTAARAVPIVVHGPGDLTTDLRQSGPRGLVHHCDGTHFLTPADRHGRPCGCPSSLAARKLRAHSGTGPAPYTLLRFYLADYVYLGVFRFTSASWHLAGAIPPLKARLTADGPSSGRLLIEKSEFSTPSGLRLPIHSPAITLGNP